MQGTQMNKGGVSIKVYALDLINFEVGHRVVYP